MAKLKLKGKDLRALGYRNTEAISVALQLVRSHFKRASREEVEQQLKAVLENPSDFAKDPLFEMLVSKLLADNISDKEEVSIYDEPLPYLVFGSEHIDSNTRHQMDVAMRLPITQAGALMPDAHVGYGLPIGGVLATENAVIPYGVGMDIGCRMCLTIYDLPVSQLKNKSYELKNQLKEHTRFGKNSFSDPMDDPIFQREEFKTISFVRRLKDKAYSQIGSSGSGNHFVEFGEVSIEDEHNEWNLPTGKYVGILSHSGSRGLGATIAQHYTRIAMNKCLLPREAKSLAWLSLDSEEGMEYWLAMNLAGDYASACHHHIHRRISRSLGIEALATVENHHNFAWREQLSDGREAIIHRKGATPAAKGVLGIIPGSMATPGFIVRGKGKVESLNSASHGAGRAMSRRRAKESFTNKEMKQYIKKMGVELIGGGLDENPKAYKDIHKVMQSQSDLVDIVGVFQPKIVRMDKA